MNCYFCLSWSCCKHGSVKVATWISSRFKMDLSKLLCGSAKCAEWISLNCYMDLSKLIHGFLQVFTWICQSCSMHFCPLPNKTKLKLDQNFKACWSFCFEVKVLNETKYSMPWVRCAFGNVKGVSCSPA